MQEGAGRDMWVENCKDKGRAPRKGTKPLRALRGDVAAMQIINGLSKLHQRLGSERATATRKPNHSGMRSSSWAVTPANQAFN